MADKCVICEAEFRAEVMSNEKCPLCVELYPKARSKKEILVKTPEKARTLTEDTVKGIVYEILEEANIKRVVCERCSKLFYRRSPAQKMCPVCKAIKATTSPRLEEVK